MQRQTYIAGMGRFICILFIAVCASCAGGKPASSSPSDATPGPNSSSSSLPRWLRSKIAEFETLPADRAPLGIWQISHRGKAAFYFNSPCCDQYNPLFDAIGTEICNPSGGFTGRGDGKCPDPVDPGTQPVLVWSHPKAEGQTGGPPVRQVEGL